LEWTHEIASTLKGHPVIFIDRGLKRYKIDLMNIALKGLWLVLMALSLTASIIFVQGIRRDLHVGDPEIAVDLSQPSNWVRKSFRVSRDGSYTMFLSSVNHTPPFDVPFAGTLAVRILDPTGVAVFERRYERCSIDHMRPDNMHWTTLQQLTLAEAGRKTWMLEVRVVRPAPAFAGVTSRVGLRKARYDPGMGGLVNYVMPIPAVGFALLALLAGAIIAKRTQNRIPFALSTLVLAAWAIAIVSRGLVR
jgi:hypothetical protein